MAIHPTAIIDRNAEIDSSVEVGPFCVIDAHVTVAANCNLIHSVYVTGWTTIGEGCVIHPYTIIGHDPQDIKYKGERTYCRVGKNNIIRENVTIHRGTIPESATVIGDDCFFLAGSHVGHNCVVGNQVTLINNALLGGHVEIGDGVTLGGAAGVHQFVRIGELAMVAGNATVTRDIIPFALADICGEIVGPNRIGLRRSDLSGDEIDDIRQAYRALMQRGSSLQEAVDRIAGEVKTSAGEKLVDFLNTDSKRGFAGRSHSISRKNISDS